MVNKKIPSQIIASGQRDPRNDLYRLCHLSSDLHINFSE